jgi:hypothetical protein
MLLATLDETAEAMAAFDRAIALEPQTTTFVQNKYAVLARAAGGAGGTQPSEPGRAAEG